MFSGTLTIALSFFVPKILSKSNAAVQGGRLVVGDVVAAWERKLVGGVNVPEEDKRRWIGAVSELWNFYGRENQYPQSVRSARWRLEGKASSNFSCLCETC